MFIQKGKSYLVRSHVRATAGTVDCEEAKAGDIQTVQVAVGVGHQLTALFSRGVGRNREVHNVILREYLMVGCRVKSKR